MEISWEFGRALYYARTARGLTQKQAAGTIGISTRWYQKLEKGDANPGFRICIQAAKALGLDLNRILGGRDLD